MISHDNITWTAQNIINHYMYMNHEDRVVSYLPLSHIAAQLIDMYCILALGGCTYFAQPDALKGTLHVTLKEVKPTFFFGVPTVYSKMEEKLRQIDRKRTGISAILLKYAKLIGTKHCQQLQFNKRTTTRNDNSNNNTNETNTLPCFYNCANKYIFSKIKQELGLDHCKGCFTAAAPISKDTIEFFASLDIPVYEVYGQSECTGPYTVSYAGIWKIGSCGRPMKGTDCKILPNTGELCYRGRHIFMGYMHMPDKTAETIDADGFLHSGDVAEFDGDNDLSIQRPSGFMKITGRIKELLITAGGENIPPVLIENEVKGACVAVSNCMLIGDKRKYLTLLVSLKVTVDADALPTDILAPDALFIGKKIGSTATTYTEAKVDPLWKKCIDDAVKVANSKTTSNAQIIQKWTWLPTDFSEKGGELTPTLKLKRNVAYEKNIHLCEEMYNE
jgi:long-chain-fatty-acid--CoA ligase ACSBG